MKIPTESRKLWAQLRSPSDTADIVKASGFSRPTISAAINGGDCSFDVFAAIQEFYNNRQSEINKLISENKKP